MSSKFYRYASVILFVMSLFIGIYLIFNIKELEKNVSNLEKNRSYLEKQKQQLENEIKSVKIKTSSLSKTSSFFEKSKIDLQNTIIGDQDYINLSNYVFRKNCQNDLKKNRDICEFMINYGDLIKLRHNSIIAIVNAASNDDYKNAIKAYRQMVSKNETMRNNETSGWLPKQSADYVGFASAGLDGIAYSYMKIGDIQQARNMINRALKITPASLSARITNLKILCLENENSELIKSYYQESLDLVRGRIEKAKRATKIDENYIRNLYIYEQMILREPELKLVCRL